MTGDLPYGSESGSSCNAGAYSPSCDLCASPGQAVRRRGIAVSRGSPFLLVRRWVCIQGWCASREDAHQV